MHTILRTTYLAALAGLTALALGTTAFAQDNVIQVADGVYAFDRRCCMDQTIVASRPYP